MINTTQLINFNIINSLVLIWKNVLTLVLFEIKDNFN